MTEQLTIRVLGGLDVQLGNKPLTDLGTRKAEALLAYLVCQQRPYPRELLADLLWDDRSQKQALANLRSLLSGLRRKLKPFLIITRQTIAFNVQSNFWLDKADFEQRLTSTTAPIDIPSLEKALALYQGNFLEGFYLRDSRGFEEWAILERERLGQIAIRGLRLLVEDGLKHGRYQTALQHNGRLLQMDSLNEQTQRQQMILQLRTGNPNAALMQYNQFQQLLHDELGVEPAPATQALFERISRIQFPPPFNVPGSLSPFVGRQAELTQITSHLLAQDQRLLTILGTGGLGKTRLARETAVMINQQLPGRFLDGIFFISLTAVQPTTSLANHIAQAIDLTLQGTEPAATQLLNQLQDKEMLLLLDNFEHLLDDERATDHVTLIANILARATAVKLLITSRERLKLYGETVFELTGLTVPEKNSENAAEFESITLFRQRAQQNQHTFEPSHQELSQIIEICRLVDGVPLALELAASWLPQHNCSQIKAEIEKNLDFLQTRYHNVPDRQRSLRAVFNHSWDLLSPELQTSFVDLAIFPDTFSAEAATAVAHIPPAIGHTLISKSLLQQDADSQRLQIHPLLHQYAQEKLKAQPERFTAVSQSHADYFLTLVNAQESGESNAARKLLHRELPNIQAAWQYTAVQQNYPALEDSTAVLQNFFSIQSWFQDGINLFQTAVQTIPQRTTPTQAQALCEILGRTARLHIQIGQIKEANQLLQQATHYLEEVEDPSKRAAFLSYTAISIFYAGDYAEAANRAQQSLHLAQAQNDLDGIAFAYNFMSSCAKAQGDFDQASQYLEQALSAYQTNNDELGTAMVLNNLGNLAQARSQFAAAQTYYDACIQSFKAIDHIHGAATTLANAGRLALKLGEYEKARNLLNESLTLKKELHDERGTAVALTGLGAISVTTNALETAKTELTEALRLALEVGDSKTILECMVPIAALFWKSGDHDSANQLVVYVLNHKAVIQEIREEAEKLMVEANLSPMNAADLPLAEMGQRVLGQLT